MKPEMIRISRKEYEELQRLKNVENELLVDTASGIKDILQGKIKEV